jgi:hypothetical protein
MSNAFRSLHSRTAAPLNKRLFGETVTYFARNVTVGIERSAIVVRNPLLIQAELGQQVGPSLIVKFLDDADEGVLASQINVEIDMVEVALDMGGVPSRRVVSQLLSSEAGWTRLLVR